MKKFQIILLMIAILFLGGPLWRLISGQTDLSIDWRHADHSSAHLAPDPKTYQDAVIQAYVARAYHARGAFAVHTWIATKPKNAEQYTVYQVVGWNLYRNLPALSIKQDIPDRAWYSQKPILLVDIRGTKAETLIPKIQKAAEDYPYPSQYTTWPGPNSNSFTAYIGRQIPELGLLIPTTAIGKDFLVPQRFFARTPSGTGYQLSLYGLFGIAIGKKEGLELSFLALVIGIDPLRLGIMLPGVGELALLKKPLGTVTDPKLFFHSDLGT